ncbi:MAG: maltose acetyltransferase domain-containing protein [Eubacteriales bacterium]|nr:maltose acetyltransferase domain-containing protein [Eubacteriales bacterium]
MTQKERMEAGLIYDPADKEIIDDQAQRLELMYEFNASRPSEVEKRTELLNRMLGKIGEECYIEPPFRANWAGKNLYLGDRFNSLQSHYECKYDFLVISFSYFLLCFIVS